MKRLIRQAESRNLDTAPSSSEPWQAGLEQENRRIASIDGFRGIAIILMFLGNFAAPVRWVPAALKHMPDIGLTFADLVAPMFIFSVALTILPSLRRKLKRLGRRQAYSKMSLRAFTLIGIGAIITAGQAMGEPTGVILSWGVLQCIGTCSLLLLLIADHPWWVRLLAGIGLLAIYQFLLDRYFLRVILASSFNGLAGTLSWAGMLMIATAITDRLYETRSFWRGTALLLLSGVLAAATGLLLSGWLPISKNRASSTYMLVSLAYCLIAFAAFHVLLDLQPGRLKWLQRFGTSPLVMFIAHLLVLGLISLPGSDGWYAGAPFWLSLLQAAAFFLIMNGLAIWLDKRKLFLRL